MKQFLGSVARALETILPQLAMREKDIEICKHLLDREFQEKFHFS